RRLREELPGPGDCGRLELVDGYHGVHQTPRERRLRVVLPAEEPDLLRALLADLSCEQADPVPAVERTDPRSRLPEPRVLARARQVAAQVQHVTAADRVPGHHREHGLAEPPDLDPEAQDGQLTDA